MFSHKNIKKVKCGVDLNLDLRSCRVVILKFKLIGSCFDYVSMVRQEEIHRVNAHFRIYLVGLGMDKPCGREEFLLKRRRLTDCDWRF